MTLLLAFDTATPQVAVALHDGRDVVADLVSEIPMKHAEQLAPLIESALRQVDARPADLTRIAVGVGPGPFTGLRVGLVTARTMAFALDLEVSGVCSLDVLALEAVETGRADGTFQVATDARRKEVYAATYGPDAARIEGPVVAKPATVDPHLLTVGEGATLYPDAFPTSSEPTRPSAAWLARGVVGDRFEILEPEPLYLRRPDAVAAAG